jgi:ElaB/YqjD/DUF883 family membrane-anchored ribosome-binding protein
LAERHKSETQQVVQEKAQQAKEQVQEATSSMQDRVREQVDTRSTEAGHQVDSVGEAMRTASQQLRGQGNELPAQVIEQVAERADQLGRYLRESDADRILGDLEDFGRGQPWVVAAGGLAVGVAAARFLKASSQRRYQAQIQDGNYPRMSSTTYTPAVHPDPAAAGYPSSETGERSYPPPPPTHSGG